MTSPSMVQTLAQLAATIGEQREQMRILENITHEAHEAYLAEQIAEAEWQEPEEIEFGSAEWFKNIPEIPFGDDMQEENERVRPDPLGFTLEDAEIVKSIFACSQCEGSLQIVPNFADNERWFVICPDCGNIESIGRISKTTVAIRNEQGIFDYPRVIRNLPDLWGHLIPTKEVLKNTIEKNLRELGF